MNEQPDQDIDENRRSFDKWATWLLQRRYGGAAGGRERLLEFLQPIRDKVLDGAGIQPGDTVLDLGCGDGLLGFGALDRVDNEAAVVFSDISQDLVERCREVASELHVSDRCRFVVDSFPDLSSHADMSADVVVFRSVLIYVADKRTAFENVHRVLKQGGRLSMFEPIVSFAFPEPPEWLWELDVRGLEHLSEKVHDCYRDYQPDVGPMTDFDERDLLEAVVAAGFDEIAVSYEMTVRSDPPYKSADWQTFLDSAPNPNTPSNGQILREALTDPAELAEMETHLRRQLEERKGRTRRGHCYLRALRSS